MVSLCIQERAERWGVGKEFSDDWPCERKEEKGFSELNFHAGSSIPIPWKPTTRNLCKVHYKMSPSV